MKHKIVIQLDAKDLDIVYQKENKILNVFDFLYPNLHMDELLCLSCYSDEIIHTCFEHNLKRIKDPTILNIVDNIVPISNYKRMLLYNYMKQLKHNIRMDELIWDILERLTSSKIEIIEKNLLPTRRDNPTYRCYLDNGFHSETIHYILHDPTTGEYYPIRNKVIGEESTASRH